MFKRFAVAAILLLATSAWGAFPVIEKGDIEPGDARLGQPIDESKEGELTIAAFNIRNLGAKDRSLNDFEAIIDLVDEADVVLLQEVGLGLLDKDSAISEKEQRRLDLIKAVFKLCLGPEWELVVAPVSTGQDGPAGGNPLNAGHEIGMLAHRKQANGHALSVAWKEYIDLGPRRDMALFELTSTKDGESQELLLGSIHTKPDDPFRGEELDAVADWMLEQTDTPAIVGGDFNFGYDSNEDDPGEIRILELHDDGEMFLLFKSLSYLKKATSTQLRTNLGYRAGGRFYDQFLMSPSLADKMADGGVLLDDCGFIALQHTDRMKKVVETDEKLRSHALNKFVEDSELELDEAALAKAEKSIARNSLDQAPYAATYQVSDHRPIWMQLKLW